MQLIFFLCLLIFVLYVLRALNTSFSMIRLRPQCILKKIDLCLRHDNYRLLDMYLDPQNGKEPMFKAAVRLLHNHGEFLDPLRVLEVSNTASFKHAPIPAYININFLDLKKKTKNVS